MKPHRTILLVLTVLALAAFACSTTAPEVQTVVVTSPPIVITSPPRVVTATLRIIVVTATGVGPTSTPEPTMAPDHTKDPKGVGSYLVGLDIAPGIWRSSAQGSKKCSLTILSLAGDMIDMTYDPPGATIRIPDGEYQVQIEDVLNVCTWTFLKP